MSHIYTTAILLAAGSGTRMHAPVAKQELCLLGESLLRHAARALASSPLIDAIVTVVREDEVAFAQSELSDIAKNVGVVTGGEDRRASAARGFAAVPKMTRLVAIHDAARPLITRRDIDAVVRRASVTGAAIAVAPIYDTVKEVGEDGGICATHDRSRLFLAATPQVFFADWYADAMALDVGGVTDDAMLLEAAGHRVDAVLLSDENRKVTSPEDLLYAEFIMKRRGETV